DWSVTGVQTCALPISQILEHDVGLLDNSATKLGRCLRVFQIYADGLLVSINGMKDCCRAVPERGPPVPRIVTLRPFNLDHLGTRSEERRVGKECRAEW